MKGYIFDLDGTLLDSMDIWNVLSIHYLESFHIKANVDLIQQLKSLSLQEAAIYIKEHYHLSQSLVEIQEGFHRQLEKEYESVTLKDGVELFLQKCAKQNIQMCVLTANHLDLTQKVLKKLHINHYFQAIISCEDIHYTKQDIRSYQYAADILKLPISKCVVVEDTLHAMTTAKKAGFYVKAIYDKANHNDWEEIKNIADKSYQSFQNMEV